MNKSSKEDHLLVARRIIERFKMFNRKERDHLIKFALCEQPESPSISSRLWNAILEKGAETPQSEDYFIAMDFHMNWLFAALATSQIEGDIQYSQWKNHAEDIAPEQIDEDCEGPIRGNQQDVDLLVAWINRKSSRLKICLIEAKLESGWTSKQLISKRDRLRHILRARLVSNYRARMVKTLERISAS